MKQINFHWLMSVETLTTMQSVNEANNVNIPHRIVQRIRPLVDRDERLSKAWELHYNGAINYQIITNEDKKTRSYVHTFNVLHWTITARDRRAEEKANTTNIAIMNILLDGMGVDSISLPLKLLKKKRQDCFVHRRRKHGRKKTAHQQRKNDEMNGK